MKKQLIIPSLIMLGLMTNPASSSWQDLLKGADKTLKSVTGQDSTSLASSSLSNDKITQGLKEALDVSVKKAIDILGTKNGFLNDKSVKILLPESMQKVEKLLRSAGQEERLDEFVNSMNRAAEKAVPQVTDIFVNAISAMSLKDAKGILSGGDTAATDYFKTHTTDDLSKLITPYVNDAMDKMQVTQYYKAMTTQIKKYDSFGFMDSYLGSASDIDKYVTDKTMEGLFTKIAVQEKLIRESPAARSTEILKDVFGSVK